MKYWKEGFYRKPIEGGIEITDEYWSELLNKQSHGYKIVSDENGYPIAEKHIPTSTELLKGELRILEQYLDDTDYMVVKCYERNLDMQTEYPEDFIKRQEARDRINEIKELLQ